jgi:chromosome partitioning protein
VYEAGQNDSQDGECDMNNDLDELLDRFKKVSDGMPVPRPKERYQTYAITNFRGGIGKSTIAFNLAWEVSRKNKSLFFDLCPQCNFTQSLLADDAPSSGHTIYDALLPKVMPGTRTVNFDDLVTSVPPSCPSFKGGEKAYSVPGSKELFLFPSLLYTQLSNASNLGSQKVDASRNILQSVKTLAESLSHHLKTKKTLIDTSPFFGGATHLGWVAADALIIPVRVDQHSMEALKLTLSMLKNHDMDFLRLNSQAKIGEKPKVHAIVMTHCGWSRQSGFTPDRSTQAYLGQVLDIARDNAELFSCDNPMDAIHLLDDFHAAGRISGSKRIPLAMLNVRDSHTIENQRLEVNESVTRYQKELKSLASSI